MKKRIAFISILLLVVLSSCAQLFNSLKSLTITGVLWNIENVPAEMWSPDAAIKPSLLLNLQIYFREDLKSSDIISARAYMQLHPEISWEIDADKFFSEKYHYLGGYTRFWLAEDIDELPLGPMVIEITLINGKMITTNTYIDADGNSREGGGRIFNSDETTRPETTIDHFASLRRAVVDSIIIDDGKVYTKFTLYGSSTRNGWIVFYNENGEYVGSSVLFCDQYLEVDTDKFSLPYFNKVGQNTFILASTDIMDGNNKSITDYELETIRHCRIITVNDPVSYYSTSPLQYTQKAYSLYF